MGNFWDSHGADGSKFGCHENFDFEVAENTITRIGTNNLVMDDVYTFVLITFTKKKKKPLIRT